ncbi:50S ribosomal protein L23 [uncultured Dubosiella sp.]|jgi:large subunit ribosomal protein L23|uniref:50S ribosomal protein L23 n=1 Tax=uncultured Dubosiella sp. TaxID=1937011 RepID=UPI000EE3058F|nr:50S ribosomal protein L23 [uncultured Dubosiella sp.]GJM58865.1 50S ribosomal protein L23 [Erysipelotrichaceae bacterium OPF54]HAM30678.1 50S ribosomal protein L23 [Erysipelotrichaceae bacterium]
MTDYRDVILRPIITEKSMKLMAEDNKVTFEIAKGVNKFEVKKAVEALFNVDVEQVNTINVKPKKRRVGRFEGKTNRVRKAIVKIKEGQTIDLFGEE